VVDWELVVDKSSIAAGLSSSAVDSADTTAVVAGVADTASAAAPVAAVTMHCCHWLQGGSDAAVKPACSPVQPSNTTAVHVTDLSNQQPNLCNNWLTSVKDQTKLSHSEMTYPPSMLATWFSNASVMLACSVVQPSNITARVHSEFQTPKFKDFHHAFPAPKLASEIERFHKISPIR